MRRGRVAFSEGLHFREEAIAMACHAAAAIMRLTPRDRYLLEALDEMRYLTAPQIQQICFSGASVQTASRRLTLLRRRGLLTCLSHRNFHDRRAFWCLASLGRAAVAELTGKRADPPRACALAALQIEHVISANQIFCDLCIAHRAGRLGSFRWFASRHASVDLGHTHLTPDAVVVTAPSKDCHWMYCLELDRGTMSLVALAAKFRRYVHLYHAAGLRRHNDPLWEARTASWVLFACSDDRRALRAARLAAETGLERFWAGPPADVAASLATAVGPDTAPPSSEAVPGMLGGITPPGPFRTVGGKGGFACGAQPSA
jgi:protein involved in plasmid replication-relaxation